MSLSPPLAQPLIVKFAVISWLGPPWQGCCADETGIGFLRNLEPVWFPFRSSAYHAGGKPNSRWIGKEAAVWMAERGTWPVFKATGETGDCLNGSDVDARC